MSPTGYLDPNDFGPPEDESAKQHRVLNLIMAATIVADEAAK